MNQIEKLESIFGVDDPVLGWIQQEIEKGKTPKQIEIDYKAFHILGGLGNESD